MCKWLSTRNTFEISWTFLVIIFYMWIQYNVRWKNCSANIAQKIFDLTMNRFNMMAFVLPSRKGVFANFAFKNGISSFTRWFHFKIQKHNESTRLSPGFVVLSVFFRCLLISAHSGTMFYPAKLFLPFFAILWLVIK